HAAEKDHEDDDLSVGAVPDEQAQIAAPDRLVDESRGARDDEDESEECDHSRGALGVERSALGVERRRALRNRSDELTSRRDAIWPVVRTGQDDTAETREIVHPIYQRIYRLAGRYICGI